MEYDPAAHNTRARSSARPEPASTGLCDSSPPRQGPTASSGGHSQSSPYAGPQALTNPRPLRNLTTQSELLPQLPLREQRGLRPQFRLRPGPDDTLIHWLDSLSPRQRSRAIRTALCQYLDKQRDPHADEWREDPDLAHALDSLF